MQMKSHLKKILAIALFAIPYHVQCADSIDIVTYNIEWLGKPENAEFKGNRSQQIHAAARDIIQGDGDIYALQEVGGSNALNDLLSSLNSQDNNIFWSGEVSQPSSSQSLAFIYKTDLITGVSFQTLFGNEESHDFAGRLPYLMNANVSTGLSSTSISLINLHLKCCTGGVNASRRAAAMSTLLTELNDNFNNRNLLILGDLNVASSGGAQGEIADWGVYTDRDGDQIVDFFHAAGSELDIAFDPNSTHSDIDHIIISNELKASWDVAPIDLRNQYLVTSVSDHSPVKTTLNLSQLERGPSNSSSSSSSSSSSNSSSSSSGSSPTQGVREALTYPVGAKLSVSGKIVDYFNTQYALLLEDLNNGDQMVVKLEADLRATWSPYLNPNIIGNVVNIEGTRDYYANQASVEKVIRIQESDQGSSPSREQDIQQVYAALEAEPGTKITISGTIVDYFNSRYAMIVRDNVYSNEIIVKLEREQHENWSPYLNPGVIGKNIYLSGIRDVYMKKPSIEQVSHITLAP